MGEDFFLDDEDIRNEKGSSHGKNRISFVKDHDHDAARFWEDDHHSVVLKTKGLRRDYDYDYDYNYNYDHAERRFYWESQEFLLQEILDQYKSSNSENREEIKKIIDIAKDSNLCNCGDKNLRGYCLKCLRRAAVHQLCSKGFSASLRTSNWKRTRKIPGGMHEYIEVMANTNGRRQHDWFLVEVGFSDEFRMAKACDEYNKLINQLPEIYIGNSDHLNAIVRVICEAARRSSDEQKIHMGPWRTRSFMQKKWSASSERKFLDHASNELSISTPSRPEFIRTVKVT